MNELQETVLEITLEIDRVCRENGIEYGLAYGSALGLANYGGFIPWDDDADVVMDISNREKFIEACRSSLDPRFVLDCIEEDAMYDAFIPMKVRKRGTFIEESFASESLVQHTEHRGVFVDIQTFVHVPKQAWRYRLLQARMLCRVLWSALSLGKPKEKMKARLKAFEARYDAENMGSGFVDQTPLTGAAILTHFGKPTFKEGDVFPFREAEFEGHKLFFVNDPVAFCSKNYGPDCFKPELYPDKKKTHKAKRYKL